MNKMLLPIIPLVILAISAHVTSGDGTFKLAKQWRDEKANRRSQVIPGSASDLVSRKQKYSMVTRHLRQVGDTEETPAPGTTGKYFIHS